MTSTPAAPDDALYRYPVKGLSPERLDRATLQAGAYFPGDRLFAVENGPAGFDPQAPQHQPKIKFLMLMRDERLAQLRTRYAPETNTLSIEQDGRPTLNADLSTEAGRSAVQTFFEDYMPDELRGPPKLLEAPAGFRFTDSRGGYVSIINLASLAAIEKLVGAPVHPTRFRANVYVSGWPAWHEADLVGQEIKVGPSIRLKVTKRIPRCAATEVDPVTGARDLAIPRALRDTFGHVDCGIYAEVIEGGPIAPGDKVDAYAPTLSL
jgi:uncharacterized protein YcbX